MGTTKENKKKGKQQNGKGKKGDSCVRALYTGDNVVDESIGASTTGKPWQHRREKEVQQLVVFLLFVFIFYFILFFPCASPCCPSLWLLMDGGLSGSGWLSLVST
jgi:hypothetical protein